MKYIFLPTSNSTNDIAKELIQHHHGNHGCVIRSDYQENGRGRQQNTWESNRGDNLLVSFIIEPHGFHPSQQFVINQLVSTTLYEFVQDKTALQNVAIKWPNDIYVGQNKIAGILIEHSILGEEIIYSIIGVGLNVNQIEFKNAPNPISLKQITSQTFNLDTVAKELSEKFFTKFDSWNFGQLEALKKSYTKSLYQYNKKQRFSIDNKEIISTIAGVTDCGMLRLVDENNIENHYELNSIKYL